MKILITNKNVNKLNKDVLIIYYIFSYQIIKIKINIIIIIIIIIKFMVTFCLYY